MTDVELVTYNVEVVLSTQTPYNMKQQFPVLSLSGTLTCHSKNMEFDTRKK